MLFLLSVQVACTPKEEKQSIEIVCTYSILADIVQNIAGDNFKVATLVPRLSDPHTYEPRPDDFIFVEHAKIIFAHGLHFEGWLDKILGPHKLKVTYVANHHPARNLDGKMVDPHTWHNPIFMLSSLPVIVDTLSKAYPEQAPQFKTRGDLYAQKLQALDREIESVFADLPPTIKRIVMTTHDAFHYFGERYGIEFIAPLGISTDAEPTPTAIQHMIDRIKKDDIRALFIENLSNQKSVEQISRETSASIDGTLYADSLSKEDGPAATYLEMLRYNTQAVKKALLS